MFDENKGWKWNGQEEEDSKDSGMPSLSFERFGNMRGRMKIAWKLREVIVRFEL